MGKIEKLLANIEKPKINKAFKENSKRRLMNYAKNETANEFFIIKVLKEILQPLNVSLYLKTAVRARLMNLKRKKSLSEVFGEIFQDSFVKILASGTIASLFFVNIIGFNTTSADIESRIFAVDGEVYIKHLGENWKKVYSNEILSIGDKIKTGENSMAKIYFYDNSVSRIAENTKIGIANLTTNIFEIKPTVLKLENGRVWNQVFPSKSGFKVETEKTSVNTKEGIFDVKSEKGQDTEIQVISKPLEIKSKNGNKFNYSKVYAGVGVKSGKNGILKEDLKKDNWTKQNQKEDVKYRKKIVQKIEETQIAKSKNFEQTLDDEKNLFSESVNLFQQLKIFFYNKNEEKIAELKQKIEENFAKSDDILKSEILDFLTKERQKLKILLPGDNLYEYKIFVSDISINLDKNGDTIGDIKIEKLNDAHELLALNDNEKLLKVLDNLSKIKNKTENKDENSLKNKLSKSNDELFLLQSLENTNTSKEVKEKIKQQKEVLAKEINKIAGILTKDDKLKTQIAKTNNYIATQNAKRVNNYIKRIKKFKSKNGQQNTLHWILEEIPNKKENIALLYSLRSKLDGELSFEVSKKIIKVRRSVK
ncbi:FecR domain-containing protein [Candidatus Gracilibacteria bacterium]|nr:FecR domain-containing protein [Candidatus Gracilibacteria bacterium]